MHIEANATPELDLGNLLSQALQWDVDRVGAALVTSVATPATIVGDHGGVFELASITKVLTATAVLVAIEEGSMTLDQPAGPEGSTVAHLLAHASGLGPDGQRLSAPGERRIYSNAGFEVLAHVLASSTGMSFATYLHESVIKPLEMTATVLDGSPASGARSTIDDLVRLTREWLDPGRVLAPETVADARRPWFGDLDGVLPGFGTQRPNPWGLGVEVRGNKSPHWTGSFNSPETFGHFGQAGGFWWIDPLGGIALLSLTDRDFGQWAIAAWPTLADNLLSEIRRAESPGLGNDVENVT